jgi:hypothetical protein
MNCAAVKCTTVNRVVRGEYSIFLNLFNIFLSKNNVCYAQDEAFRTFTKSKGNKKFFFGKTGFLRYRKYRNNNDTDP